MIIPRCAAAAPLTTGEVLDAAVVLLRAQPRRLVVIGLIIALVEQAILSRRAGWRRQLVPA